MTDTHHTAAYTRELEVASELAREAGDIALRCRASTLSVDMKPGNEPVTDGDRAASKHIVAGLQAAFPSDVIISEESADDLRRLTHDRVWYVDPIDGTKDYVRGEEGFCVMIGLAKHAQPVLGVLFQPTAGGLFCAAVGHGASLTMPDGASQTLTCSTVDNINEVRLVVSKSHRTDKIDTIKSALGIQTEFNIGSVGLKIGLIALGERDLYVNPSSKCKSWDTCAPQAVLECAGGKLTDVYGRPLRYDIEDLTRPHGMVASNGHIHGSVVAKLSSLFTLEQ